jgi:two-component system, NarL family, nitrate/nitrite response regulator NarL
MADIRILVIAHDPLARAGLASLLGEQAGFIVVGRVSDEPTLPSEIDLYHAEIGVWDLGWEALSEDGGRFDAALIEEIVEVGLPLVVLTPTGELASPLWAAGVRSILLRASAPEQIAAAINASLHGLATVEASFADQLVNASVQPELTMPDSLTPREYEVLRFIAEGYSNKAIALALKISEHTVKFHINSLMSKLNAQSRTEAVVRATRLGLITL